jgi:hypothetical protein
MRVLINNISNMIPKTKHALAINLQAESAVAITKHDTTTYSPSCLYVGTGGTVKVIDNSGNTTSFTNVPDGSILPVLVTKVFSTDTTASGFVLLS